MKKRFQQSRRKDIGRKAIQFRRIKMMRHFIVLTCICAVLQSTASTRVLSNAGDNYCPFDKTADNSPCVATECMHSKINTPECKTVVEAYCSKYKDNASNISRVDAGCVQISKTVNSTGNETQCPFSNKDQESPCQASQSRLARVRVKSKVEICTII